MFWKAGFQMLHIKKCIIPIHSFNIVRHLLVVSSSWISIANEDVMNPVRDYTLCIHQTSNSFKDSLHRRQNITTKGNEDVQ
jgi:hypothetical protein